MFKKHAVLESCIIETTGSTYAIPSLDVDTERVAEWQFVHHWKPLLSSSLPSVVLKELHSSQGLGNFWYLPFFSAPTHTGALADTLTGPSAATTAASATTFF